MTGKLAQQIRRIDHIVFLVRTENLDRAVGHFSRLFDIEFEGPYVLEEHSLTVYVDWSSGLEFIAPTASWTERPGDPEISEFLESRGEGFFRLVFGVSRIEDSLERAKSLGHDFRFRSDGIGIGPDWHQRFRKIDEAFITPAFGIGLVLSEIVPA